MPRRLLLRLLLAGAVCSVAGGGGVAGASSTSWSNCRIVGMRPFLGPLWSEKTGQHTVTVVLTNRLTRPCLLRGYPVVELLDGRGARLDFVYSHGGDQMITPRAPTTVRVGAAGSAYFAFNKYRCDLRTLASARTLRIALPGSAAARSLRLARYPIIDYCGHGGPSGTIAVSPLEPTLGRVSASP